MSVILRLDGESLTIAQLINAVRTDFTIEITAEAKQRVINSRNFVDEVVRKGDSVYGVNTGFGLLSEIRIPDSDLEQLQTNLIRSHASGIGNPLDSFTTLCLLILRTNVLLKGYSGVRYALIEQLLLLIKHRILPVIPEKGSVGACGDLAPLAHLALVIIGEGEVFYQGQLLATPTVFKKLNISPLALAAKEGLALINGTQVMTAIGCRAVFDAEILFKSADIIGSCTLDALRGTTDPFDADIQNIRPHPGQKAVASNFLSLLDDDEIRDEHKDCGRVQDPYSLRCIPQVHGACRDVLNHVTSVLQVEINAATDNPLIFAEKNKILSGGNFHGQPIAFAMDYLCLACAEIGSIAERRIEKLINPALSAGLPPFLINNSGLNSGFMIPHVAAASLVSENKILCHPASIDSIPTSADKEDHVSMGSIASRKALQITNNVRSILAIEAMAACQGLDFRKPLQPGIGPRTLHALIRKQVPYFSEDQVFYPYIEKVSQLIYSGEIVEAVAAKLETPLL